MDSMTLLQYEQVKLGTQSCMYNEYTKDRLIMKTMCHILLLIGVNPFLVIVTRGRCRDCDNRTNANVDPHAQEGRKPKRSLMLPPFSHPPRGFDSEGNVATGLRKGNKISLRRLHEQEVSRHMHEQQLACSIARSPRQSPKWMRDACQLMRAKTGGGRQCAHGQGEQAHPPGQRALWRHTVRRYFYGGVLSSRPDGRSLPMHLIEDGSRSTLTRHDAHDERGDISTCRGKKRPSLHNEIPGFQEV